MLNRIPIDRVYLACGVTDLRKSIDGLAAIVQESFQLDPFSSNLFVFCNRNRDKLKILHWENNGFWLYYRRLETDTFQWPNQKQSPMVISTRQFNWLLEGLSLEQKHAHQKLSAKIMI